MNIIAAGVYWVVVCLWITIFSTVAKFYFRNDKTFGTTRLLLAVLALDALRNIIENVYFGLYFGAKLGFLPASLVHTLGNPYLLILPKLTNICAGCIVMALLLLRWLPQEIRERAETERLAKHLHELATTDGMTGLVNRRQFITLAEAEWERSHRYHRNLCLLMLDIDRFKSINDNHGHYTGDEIIIIVAKLCLRQKRRSDVAGRLGGEEFAILLPETKQSDAYIFAERLRSLISAEYLSRIDGDISATVSIGMSTAAEAGSVSELLKQADTALYQAKRSGRNCVCCFASGSAGSMAISSNI
jgi:diguanylate cyclase (GGDEF)-like protein